MRLAWPDVVKGVCILLVVLYHSSMWMKNEVYGTAGPWVQIGYFLTPVRMPIFFFVSGYFSISLLSRPLAASRRRTIGLLYLYVIWTGLFLARLYVPFGEGQQDPPTFLQFLMGLVLPTSFWYLWALPVYFMLTHALVKVLGPRSWWFVFPLLVVSFLSPMVRSFTSEILLPPMDAVKGPSVLGNFVWFFVGTQSKQLWNRAMAHASWPRFAAAATAYVGIWVVTSRGNLTVDVNWQLLPMSIIAIYMASQLLGLVPMESRPFVQLTKVGQDTLPIYVFHIFLISIISLLVKASGLDEVLRNDLPNLSWAVPPVMVVLLTWACLVMARVIRGSRLAFLLQAPRALVADRSSTVRMGGAVPEGADRPGPTDGAPMPESNWATPAQPSPPGP